MKLPRVRDISISLADKCLLVFGAAVVLIVAVALFLPWLRMNALVNEGQLEVSRSLMDTWVDAADDQGGLTPGSAEFGGIEVRVWLPDDAAQSRGRERFAARALAALQRNPARRDYHEAHWRALTLVYHYARPLRADDESVESLLVAMDRPSSAARMLAVNTLYLIVAGCIVLALAVLVFYLIIHRLILDPVRKLKDTAERVRQGDLSIRSQIETGDEFQQLAETFNGMLAELQRAQEQLHANNTALDMKVSELSERNTLLFESARVKGQFLANVSHELRTPMNSVIGFGELLLEIAHAEAAAGDDSTRLTKRTRYLENIVSAARQLLEMITGLLEMAKIEAGKVELNIEKVSLHEACEGLIGLIYPLAQRCGIELKLEVSRDTPMIETDLQKLQQVIFNLLSNAVKFSGSADEANEPTVVLRAEPLHVSRDEQEQDRVRISVIDSGPGIAPDDQERIFEAFYQLDGTHTREHTGTGLGLTICRELAALLQAEIQVESELGRGSMFSLIIPVRINPDRIAETRLESAFRGTLAGRREWTD
ncbi:MAG: HAMP domain-containing histidine kinase [Planctomycetes bacterium]|nr:HAMP domain-containing histidine kinase [Planctomycetota bacterium]